MLESNILIGFLINLIAVLIFTGGIYFPRHKRRDLFVTFTFFNIATFTIVSLISSVELGFGAGIGLFALLGIIRLRSETFSNYEVGYFFGCLALAIINSLAAGNYAMLAVFNIAIILSIALLDNPKLLPNYQHSQVSLDAVYPTNYELVAALENLLRAKVLKYSVTKIDRVRDITDVIVDYRKAL
ncbi:DUF4956 domain-containing protein [Candidatus Saccharibacteria bacterium]|nr:DUF4956 domain-containing protein [Candidatus Saccharibacteria bacterium]